MHFWNERQVNNLFISAEKKGISYKIEKLIEIIMVVRESYAS